MNDLDGWRLPLREALERIKKPNLRSVGEIAYNNPARTCGCANQSVNQSVTADGSSCLSCGTYLHGPRCAPGCVCAPSVWWPEAVS